MSGMALNSGSRFKVEIKLSASPALSLLIVEDDKIALDIFGRMLAKKFPGITINIAENGTMGVQRFKEHAADIVITDLNMPGLNGIQMIRVIKGINADVKIIVLTGYNDEFTLQQLSETGNTAVIVKPIDFGKLFALVEKCIDEITLERR
jgi:YesN/AraC family two-component response regulator